MTTTTTDWPWADEWIAEGFLPFTPKAEKRPFGYHATPPDKTTPPVVPCPNCDAPNERNYWQHNGLEGLRDIKYEDPDAARKAAEDPKKYWKELHNHPSKYEVARCRFCGAEVRIPGGYRHGDKDVVWYYKPAPIPDKPVLVIDTMLNAPALFAHQWVDGSIVTHPEDRPWVSPYMLVDLFRSDRPHLLVNAYTGNLRFITGYQVMPSAKVRINYAHATTGMSGVGIWRCARDYQPDIRETAIFHPLAPLCKQLVHVFEHDFLATDLPLPVQVEYIKQGLAIALDWDFPLEFAAAETYLSALRLDPRSVLRDVPFVRARAQVALRRRMRVQAEPKSSDGQMKLF